MRVLFVTPSEVASGEAITALHMAENLAASGVEVRFLASAFAARFLKVLFHGEVTEFGSTLERNREVWQNSLIEFKPDTVVFADYPLLFFSSGAPRLADDSWVESLADVCAALITLDHFGYAQKAQGIYFGPAHLSFHAQNTPNLPERMEVLLPCPMHEPGPVPGRRGQPFKYCDIPSKQPDEFRRQIRKSYLQDDNDLLIFHATSNWAWGIAKAFGLPYYALLPKLLEQHLADVPRTVTVVSVNNGNLLPASMNSRLRIINRTALPRDEYDRLLFAADLMITENGISSSLGKAICGLLPCAVLRNSYTLEELLRESEEPLRNLIMAMENVRLGSIFPFEVFPIWGRAEIEELGLFNQNTVTGAFKQVEIFGGSATRRKFKELIFVEESREQLRAQQTAYLTRVHALPDANESIRLVIQKERSL